MYLPGTIGERIGDLRSLNKLSQKKLAEKIGVVPSQLSRIERGEINISSDILVKLSNAFGVSTDYILGLTTISVRKSYDISELGLSEGAARGLITDAVNVQILNRLMEHKTFPYLLNLINIYFSNSAVGGIMARNNVIDMATAMLGDFVKDYPEHKAELQGDARYLRSEKLGDHEAEIEKIKSTFIAILRDIKKELDDGKEPETPATAEFLQTMREQVQIARQKQQPVTAENITDMMINMLGKSVTLDEKSMDLFKQLAMGMMTKQ